MKVDDEDSEEGQILDSPIKKPFLPLGINIRENLKGVYPISKYDLNEKVGDGTFGYGGGIVLMAFEKDTRKKVALKKILTTPNTDIVDLEAKSKDYGIPVTTLREIKYLKLVKHENCVELLEIAFEKGDLSKGKRGISYMVFPYMDYDLTGLLGNSDVHLKPYHIKCFMRQMLKGIEHLHKIDILHRDIKGANILINEYGELKLADFGLARNYVQNGNMTTKVCTLWYRPPELLLCDGEKSCKYTPAVDMWGIGCIFGEMWRRSPLITGKDELDQLTKIFKLLGTPIERELEELQDCPLVKNGTVKGFGKILPTFSEIFSSGSYQDVTYRLLKELLSFRPSRRLTATQALNSDYFYEEPYAARPRTSDFIPPFPKSHEIDYRKSYGRVEVAPIKDFISNRRGGDDRKRDDRRDSDRRDSDRRDNDRRDSDRRDNDRRDSDRRDNDRRDNDRRRSDHDRGSRSRDEKSRDRR